jgi:nitrate/nitrite-specific signal transduction histidine kinase
MLKSLCAGLLALLAGIVPAAQAAADPALAIDLAGSQRMLSQRLVKAYCQLALNVLPVAARQQMDDSIQRFERNLSELRAAATSPPASAALERVGAAWRPLRKAATGMLAREAAGPLSAAAQEVLVAADELTRILEGEARTPLGGAINLAGRQRMLSQRMAKAYMLRALGHDSPALRRDMQSAADEFAAALATLKSNPDNTSEIRNELDDLALQWEWFRNAALDHSSSFHLIVAESGEAILQVADRLTALYRDLARRGPAAAAGRPQWG